MSEESPQLYISDADCQRNQAEGFVTNPIEAKSQEIIKELNELLAGLQLPSGFNDFEDKASLQTTFAAVEVKAQRHLEGLMHVTTEAENTATIRNLLVNTSREIEKMLSISSLHTQIDQTEADLVQLVKDMNSLDLTSTKQRRPFSTRLRGLKKIVREIKNHTHADKMERLISILDGLIDKVNDTLGKSTRRISKTHFRKPTHHEHLSSPENEQNIFEPQSDYTEYLEKYLDEDIPPLLPEYKTVGDIRIALYNTRLPEVSLKVVEIENIIIKLKQDIKCYQRHLSVPPEKILAELEMLPDHLVSQRIKIPTTYSERKEAAKTLQDMQESLTEAELTRKKLQKIKPSDQEIEQQVDAFFSSLIEKVNSAYFGVFDSYTPEIVDTHFRFMFDLFCTVYLADIDTRKLFDVMKNRMIIVLNFCDPASQVTYNNSTVPIKSSDQLEDSNHLLELVDRIVSSENGSPLSSLESQTLLDIHKENLAGGVIFNRKTPLLDIVNDYANRVYVMRVDNATDALTLTRASDRTLSQEKIYKKYRRHYQVLKKVLFGVEMPEEDTSSASNE